MNNNEMWEDARQSKLLIRECSVLSHGARIDKQTMEQYAEAKTTCMKARFMLECKLLWTVLRKTRIFA